MAYLIILIFVLVCILAFFEDRLLPKQKMILFVAVGACLVLMAGFREIGIDPDSQNYEHAYSNYFSDKQSSMVETSFIIVCAILNFFTSDAHALFLFYAFFGLLLKFIAIRRLAPSDLFLSVAVYLSYFYECHEMMQIRTGILSGCFLLAVKEIGDRQRMKALGYILCGAVFHVSGLILLPLVLLSTKRLTLLYRIVWSALVLAALLASVGGDTILGILSGIPYIGDKLSVYQAAADWGKNHSVINGFGVFHLMSVSLFFILMYFSNLFTDKNRYFPLLLKIYAIGLMSYTILGFLPELGARVSFLFRIVTIPLFVTISYSVVPRWLGIAIVELIALIYLNYGLHFIDFNLLWKTA